MSKSHQLVSELEQSVNEAANFESRIIPKSLILKVMAPIRLALVWIKEANRRQDELEEQLNTLREAYEK